MPLTTGTRVGAYGVVSQLGEGGMGEVCRAPPVRVTPWFAAEAAAAAAPARADAAREMVYPKSGSRGLFWLHGQARPLSIERRRGNLERAAAIERRLTRLLAVADDHFVRRSLVQ